MDEIGTAAVLTIRECGRNEYWLRDRIFEDPTMLGLGDLQPVMKEKGQSQGGRLDLLLKNPEDDSMFEVELQLGPTDESHIIRTIEYWDAEKRRWPSRSHTAVLVAEEITNRFFNVVHLLGMAVPIIGIQVNMVQVGQTKGLHFTKVIDSYEEPEDEGQTFDENHWIGKYPGTLECVKWYRAMLEGLYGEVPIKYFETYVSLSVNGTARVWVTRRKSERAFVEVKHGEDNFQEAVDHLNKEGASFGTRSGKYLTFNVNASQLKDRTAIHEWLAARLAPQSLRKSVGGPLT
jgi:hypothetical protein